MAARPKSRRRPAEPALPAYGGPPGPRRTPWFGSSLSSSAPARRAEPSSGSSSLRTAVPLDRAEPPGSALVFPPLLPGTPLLVARVLPRHPMPPVPRELVSPREKVHTRACESIRIRCCGTPESNESAHRHLVHTGRGRLGLLAYYPGVHRRENRCNRVAFRSTPHASQPDSRHID